jgi:hypothetical protein
VSRSIAADLATDIAAERATVLHFLEMRFLSGTVYLNTGYTDISYTGQTYTAIGGALGFEAVQEGTDANANAVVVHLSGVDQALLSALLEEDYQGRVVNLSLAHMNTGGTLVADPLLLFSGRMSGGFVIEESRDTSGALRGGTVDIAATFVDRLADLEQVRGYRLSNTSLAAEFAAEQFFAFLSGQVAPSTDLWGK